MKNRVEVMHGVNLDTLGRRDPEHYGTITLPELELKIKRFAHDLELEVRFFQTNHEGEFVEHLHRLPEVADAALLNPGAWTHYSYAIRDALEIAGVPAVEVHLSDVHSREEWRRHSVLEGLVIGAVSGKGPDGYREALEMLKQALGVSAASRAERLAALLAERGPRPAPGRRPRSPRRLRPRRDLEPALADRVQRHQRPGDRGRGEDRVFLTDFRYVERAQREVAAEFERAIAERELLAGAASGCAAGSATTTPRPASRTSASSSELVPEGVELVAAGGLVERLRRRKDDGELRAIAEAARLADQVYEWIFDRGVVGRTEREIMLDAHQRMRELGADDPSFPAIVAAGENSALPHHSSSEREVGAGELLLIDMGAIVDGYCSDCTRTVATGEIDDEAREVYELVRSAQATALEAIRAGMQARDADSAARDPIAAAGHGEHFGHGLGHGVGLEVHEAPRLSQRSDQTLEVGDVVTVEPGIYLPGRFGVRIEDLVTVTEDGCRNLSSFPKELRVVG